jgi:hypothetical protein
LQLWKEDEEVALALRLSSLFQVDYLTALSVSGLYSVDQLAERKLVEETEVFGENHPQCHFFHHKFHVT